MAQVLPSWSGDRFRYRLPEQRVDIVLRALGDRKLIVVGQGLRGKQVEEQLRGFYSVCVRIDTSTMTGGVALLRDDELVGSRYSIFAHALRAAPASARRAAGQGGLDVKQPGLLSG